MIDGIRAVIRVFMRAVSMPILEAFSLPYAMDTQRPVWFHSIYEQYLCSELDAENLVAYQNLHLNHCRALTTSMSVWETSNLIITPRFILY